MAKKITVGGPVLGGTITDTDTQYTRDRYEEVRAMEPCTAAQLTAWRNDTALSELVLFTGDCGVRGVTVRAEDLVGENGGRISGEHICLTYLKSTLAYDGYPGYGNRNPPPPVTRDNRKESVDILYQPAGEEKDLAARAVQPVWVSISVPKDARAGRYTTTITAGWEGAEGGLTFTYTLEVADAVLYDPEEFRDHFDLELWQYPYSVAEYYGTAPFSPEHFAILRPHMELYRRLGGHAITATILEDAWDGQTYSKNPVAYPSMVRWTLEQGEMHYDYTALDRWITFNKELGLGDKIVLYSVAPWHNSFTYWEEGQLVRQSFLHEVGGERYTRMWRHFFIDLARHLTERGWFESAYIGIDERGLTQEALDVIFSVRNEEGLTFKTASAVNDFEGHWDQALQINDVTVSNHCVPGHEEAFVKFTAARRAKGFRTTLYTCTEDKPGNFCLSAPAESYWSVMDAGRYTGGMLRWAYDAWVEDPLRDATHSAFEPGDCFLVYPGERDRSDRLPRSSVRLEQMARAVRDVNKLRRMEADCPELKCKVEELYSKVKFKAQAVKYGQLLSREERRLVVEDVRRFRAGLDEITKIYRGIRP